MRVAHVISTPRGIGGAERTLVGLVRGGLERGWTQLVLNPFADPAVPAHLASAVAPIEYEAFPVPAPSSLLTMRSRLKQRLARFAPDIVHAHLFHATVAVASLERTAATIATQQHGSFYANQGRRVRDRIDRWATSRFDRIVAISPYVREFVVTHHGYPARRVVEIPNGWSGTPRDRKVGTTRQTIVSVGNLRPEKGHSVLLNAFAELKRQRPDLRLVLVGDGPLRNDLELHARELGVNDSVQFTGWLEDVWELLATADVFAIPSHSEALGLAALEAMAAGVPVIASAVGGLKDLIHHEKTGLLVRPGDPTVLHVAIERVLDDVDLATRISEGGRRVADGYKMERIAERYAELYEELAS